MLHRLLLLGFFIVSACGDDEVVVYFPQYGPRPQGDESSLQMLEEKSNEGNATNKAKKQQAAAKLAYVLPYAAYHEARQNWRPLFFAKFFGKLANC